MGCSNLCATLRARLDGREDPVRVVSFQRAFTADRTSPNPPLSQTLHASSGLLSLTSRDIHMYIDGERILY